MSVRFARLVPALALLTCFVHGPASAQSQSIVFHHLTLEDGLPQLDVEAILQDSLGFMWFGTEDGLVRYDGHVLRVFRPMPFDSSSLSSSWIVGLAIDGDGFMWTATEGGGLNRYDPRFESFQRYPSGETVSDHILWSMHLSSDGALWLGARDENLSRYDPATRETSWFVHDPDNSADQPGLSDSQVNAIAEDDGGNIWVGTDAGGINRINPATGSVTHYRGLPDNRVLDVTFDSGGTLWAGTGRGLVRYDDATDSFVAVSVPAEDWPRTVTAVFPDPRGTLWLGTTDGLVRFDPADPDASATSYHHDPANPASISEGSIHTMYLDRAGVMWVGTESGVSSFLWSGPEFDRTVYEPGNPNSLSDPGVWSFHAEGDSVLWVGTESGLDRFDEHSGEVLHYRHDPGNPASLSPGWIVSLLEDSQGTFWVGSRRDGAQTGTLHEFDRTTGQVVARYQQDVSDPTTMQSDNPWRLFEDSAGRFWVLSGGTGCLNLMDRATGKFQAFCRDPDEQNTPTDDAAKTVAELPDGVLWFATWGGGLNRFDLRNPGGGIWTAYQHDPDDRNTPADDYMLTMYAAADSTLWLGSYGGGLDRFDPATGVFTHFNTANSGLPNDVIYAIEGDDDGHLWISTNAGLTRYDPGTDRFRTFGLEHGLQDLEFNAVSSYRAPDGELFFGGIKGFNRFYPSDIVDEATAPNVVLTDLRVRGQQVLPTGVGGRDGVTEQVLSKALPYTETISLGAREHDFAVTFASLDFANPTLHRYRYQLVGYDDEWREAGSERLASYTNLDAGTYHLVVQTTNAVGAWVEPGAKLTVVVRPHWARTWWAYLLYTLLVFTGVAILVANYRSRMAMRHRLHLEQIEAEKLRELDQTRSRFFANVSHEFRTPLTLTLGPLEDLQSGMYGELSPDVTQQVDLARRNAGRVLELINQILDIARIEAGRTPLHAHHIDASDFLRGVADAFMPLARRKQISLTTEIPESGQDVYADPQHLEKIVANLLSNAIKFTPEGGEVSLTLESDDKALRIHVRDTGPGIPGDDLPYIFDRFYRASESTSWNQLGTGIGLSLAKELAELHKGTLTVSSEPGAGSVFTLTLMRGLDHLGPDQLVSASSAVASESQAATSHSSKAIPDEVADEGHDAAALGDEATTVLVVDDNAEIRAYIRRHLEGTYQVKEAEDGAAGLVAVRAAPPDIVISDVMMPEMDGFEFCRVLKSDPETDFIPVVLLTAKAEHNDRMEGLHERADDYITKPFRVDELKVRVRNLIESRRRLKELFSSRGDGTRPGIMIEAASPTSADEEFLARVGAIVSANIDNEDFTVEQFAEQVGLDRSHLYRRLRDLVDMSPADLLMKVRLERAAELLAAQAGNVGEIAYAVGFKSVAHFSRRFKQQYGATPTAFRAAR